MFIGDMSLVYLISTFESSLESMLSAIFYHRPEILNSSKKNLTYEEILICKDIDELKEKIIEREVESIIRDDIDIIRKYLVNNLKLDFTAGKFDWPKFEEFFYRRHTIIHNEGFPDSKYKIKTGYSGSPDKLRIDKEYLEGSFQIFEKCSEIIRKSAYDKFAR